MNAEGFTRAIKSKFAFNSLMWRLRKFPSISTALPTRFLHPVFPIKLQKAHV